MNVAHVGTHEHWVQLALARNAPTVPLDRDTAKLRLLMAEQNRVLAEIDEAARAVPRAVLFYDPNEAEAWPLKVGDRIAVIEVHAGAECVFIPPRWREERRAILEERLEAVRLELDTFGAWEHDDEPEVAVWSKLRPNGLDLEGTHCTRREVRCPADLDVRSKMMQAFCWPTAIHPYRWPS